MESSFACFSALASGMGALYLVAANPAHAMEAQPVLLFPEEIKQPFMVAPFPAAEPVVLQKKVLAAPSVAEVQRPVAMADMASVSSPSVVPVVLEELVVAEAEATPVVVMVDTAVPISSVEMTPLEET
eukprot:1939490-Pyramimonas_sp.AAC.1